jgi:small-conductance mechanosensitive channel
MSTYTTRIKPTGNSLHLGISLKRFIPRITLKRSVLFASMMFIALIAFEIFNYSTTEFALTDLLSDLRFAGIRWATILALAFCGMDFAGIARLLTPDEGESKLMESWYLLGAWLLAATMNAMLTWWAVSLALLDHGSLGNEIISRETLLNSVPLFVAILVWLIRVLMIGIFTLTGQRVSNKSVATSKKRSTQPSSTEISRSDSSQRASSPSINSRSIHPAPKSRTKITQDF